MSTRRTREGNVAAREREAKPIVIYQNGCGIDVPWSLGLPYHGQIQPQQLLQR